MFRLFRGSDRLKSFAEACAWDAHENHFPTRRGIWFITNMENVVVLYNNNPYAKGRHYRDEETDRIRERLAVEGMEEVAYVTYPPEGEEQAGYTYAMVIRATEEQQRVLEQIVYDAVRESFELLAAN
jgi:hypothetical protein